MLTKKFKAVQMSTDPIEGEAFGYVMLAQDAEMWRVSRGIGDASAWKLGEVVEMPLHYLGAERLDPDWERVDCSCWQKMQATNRYAAVNKFWGTEVADRFVAAECDGDSPDRRDI